MTNLIEDIGFTNPNNNPVWKNTNGGKYDVYYGQLPPNFREELDEVLDDQKDRMVALEDDSRKKNLPKQALVLGVGVIVILTVLIIKKYR